MEIRESGENYLETIYTLQKKVGDVRSIDIATELGYSKPSISRAMGILKNAGYIMIDNKSGVISFTRKGLDMAKTIYSRHETIRNFFIRALGIDEKIAEADACRIEHVISDEIIDSMEGYLKK